MQIKVKLVKDGVMPKIQKDGDVCFDCCARLDAEKLVIGRGNRAKVPLGFAIELPYGYEAVMRPRSGLTSKGVDNGIGTIDAGYRGEVCAIVINNSASEFVVKNGDRVCQMAIREVPFIELVQTDELSETERGSTGFGSSGV